MGNLLTQEGKAALTSGATPPYERGLHRKPNQRPGSKTWKSPPHERVVVDSRNHAVRTLTIRASRGFLSEEADCAYRRKLLSQQFCVCYVACQGLTTTSVPREHRPMPRRRGKQTASRRRDFTFLAQNPFACRQFFYGHPAFGYSARWTAMASSSPFCSLPKRFKLDHALGKRRS